MPVAYSVTPTCNAWGKHKRIPCCCLIPLANGSRVRILGVGGAVLPLPHTFSKHVATHFPQVGSSHRAWSRAQHPLVMHKRGPLGFHTDMPSSKSGTQATRCPQRDCSGALWAAQSKFPLSSTLSPWHSGCLSWDTNAMERPQHGSKDSSTGVGRVKRQRWFYIWRTFILDQSFPDLGSWIIFLGGRGQGE